MIERAFMSLYLPGEVPLLGGPEVRPLEDEAISPFSLQGIIGRYEPDPMGEEAIEAVIQRAVPALGGSDDLDIALNEQK